MIDVVLERELSKFARIKFHESSIEYLLDPFVSCSCNKFNWHMQRIL
jgi:hypothetical protein